MNTYVKCGTSEVDVLNVYILPVNSYEFRYLPNISPLLEDKKLLVLGNVNAHHKLCHSGLDNAKRDQRWQSTLTTPHFAG